MLCALTKLGPQEYSPVSISYIPAWLLLVTCIQFITWLKPSAGGLLYVSISAGSCCHAVWSLVHHFRGACFLACPPALGCTAPLVWRPPRSGYFTEPVPQRLRRPLWPSSFPLSQLLAEPHFWHVHWAGLRDSRDWWRFTWRLHRREAEDRGPPSPGVRWGRKRWALGASRINWEH